MPLPQAVLTFWQKFLASLPPQAPPPTLSGAWYFGSDSEMAARLGELVRQGTKTATAGLLWSYEAENEPLPEPGQHFVILNWEGRPLCVIKTCSAVVLPFEQVGAEHAFLEGEGDRSLAYWREVHWEFFSRECREIGREPTKSMPVVCERFRLVWLE